MSSQIWCLRAELASGGSLEIWHEGEFTTAGSILDLMPKMKTNNIKSITLTREEPPKWP